MGFWDWHWDMVELHEYFEYTNKDDVQKETKQIRICQLEKLTTRGKCKVYKEIKVL